jgi:heme-degrading monooxygenase HmoA
MFVSIIQFPKIKDEAFKAWFKWSNSEFSKFPGFVRRSLLEPEKGGTYAAIVEMEEKESFMTMHSSPIHAEAGKKAVELFEGSPTPNFYKTIIQ